VSGSTGIAEAAALSPTRKRWTLLAVILGSGIVFLDTSVVNLALPRIGEELSSELFGTLEAQSYVANAYFVTLSALLILAGALSDYVGRRRMFATGLVGFAATSLLCGIAPTMEFLIVCRTLQGAAGALLVPGSLAIITATFQGEEQGRAFGLWAGASGATTILGPFVGGLLVNTISWRMAFLINLPFLLGIFMIGTLGYNEQAAGIAGVPSTLFLVLVSSRFGRLGARYGPRLFMSLGPAIMALGLLWLARIPADSQGWMLGGGRPASILPPADYFTDLLPGLVVFGIGLSIMVAPLTTALMTSVPTRNSGVASAINNAISRVGSPLVNALIFVAVAASFYGTIGQQVPGVDTGSPEFRNAVAPLNQPSAEVSPEVRAAADQASTEAFHLAMLVAAALLAAGAAVNGLGIRNPAPAGPLGGAVEQVRAGAARPSTARPTSPPGSRGSPRRPGA
jgi:hypothetical protein